MQNIAWTIIQCLCDVMILVTTSNDIVMTTFDINRTFRVVSLTSGVRILDHGFLHNLILRSGVRLSDGLITTTMSSVMALLYVDIIWAFRMMRRLPFIRIQVLTFVPNPVLLPCPPITSSDAARTPYDVIQIFRAM